MNRLLTVICLAALTASYYKCSGQTISIDASNIMQRPREGHLRMGNPGPEEKKILANSLYLTIGGKPILPVMGELHFSRVNRDMWEDCILKMKACGINIISTYLFWNQHEEIEGQFNWDGNRDIRAFVELCNKHGLFAYLRIGPWSHGEARNGGTPDWILKKKYLTDRSNDIVYQTCVRRYFSEIMDQVKGLFYKDGGNIIGIQLENEYWYSKAGEPHILWLKQLAKELGADVPLYTVTGWGGGSVPPLEVIPLWGAYADAPWVEHINTEYQPGNFKFDFFRDNKNIGNDQLKQKEEYMTYEAYPYFTCEMGVGIQNTYHRRLRINPLDGPGMMYAKLGSGSNLLGYYIFAGGTQSRGELRSMEEEQEETGYWSRVPAKSYDFQAAIRESGEISPAYHELKKLHYFTNAFGPVLAPLMPVVARTKENSMQVAVRGNNHSGFVFSINYSRNVPQPERKNVKFNIKLAGERLTFPIKAFNVSDSTIFIWPFNFKTGDATVKYATAQLLTKTGNTYIFFQNKNIPVEMAFENARVSTPAGTVVRLGNISIVSDLKPGRNCIIYLKSASGAIEKIIVLKEEEANAAWVLEKNGTKEFYLSHADMYAGGEKIYMLSSGQKMEAYKLDAETGIFHSVSSSVPVKEHHIKLQDSPLLSDAKWLETAGFKSIDASKQRYRRFFFKEFSLNNPSKFKRATLFLFGQNSCEINLNDQWIRQTVVAGKLNVIDLTGYIKKDENMLYLAFPYTTGSKLMAGRVIVEYYNNDRVEFSTDESWISTGMYTNPSVMRSFPRPTASQIVKTPAFADSINYDGFSEWKLRIPFNETEGTNNTFLHIDYSGDRAELYSGYRLTADDFNANTSWRIGLKRLDTEVEGRSLKLVIYPLTKDTKVYFDIKPTDSEYNKATIKGLNILSEYKTLLKSEQ